MVEVLVTGGAGFIGSNFVRHALAAHPDWRVTTLDKLTYAGRRENLHDVMDNPRHTFVHGDIADAAVSGPLVERSEIVVHFAAETHVDRSIMARRRFHPHRRRRDVRAARGGAPRERACAGSCRSRPTRSTAACRPAPASRPTSSSRAIRTRRARPARIGSPTATGPPIELPVIITRASNNYGPYQFPEKVIPLFVTNAIDDIPVPLYGDGKNVRDWLHVARSLPRHRSADRARRPTARSTTSAAATTS